ncbi:prepilin-type N-terminal cleavage/methylation domain-containing protein [Staphylococcus agnetis]|uniref:competence type IV pilus minor pilin ComGD n=2 Tax=Staphylococcus TaxID=1279 RepID=UPI00208FCD15|nr:competence type IV pilus minor pilin ComGD [Staphylococcus agnetis]MCO4339163.1 prepilin-type N-terminal cleavage/methylation domain-containing protein [Staphylococcus agnetis]
MHRKHAFTLIETMLVLSIISTVIFLTVVQHSNNNQPSDLDAQIALLTSRIDFYQSLAIKKEQPVLLLFRPYHNDIKVKIGDNAPTYVSLKPLILSHRSNLDYLNFSSNGKISKFGTLFFSYKQTNFSLIFHIEQGRYRVSF